MVDNYGCRVRVSDGDDDDDDDDVCKEEEEEVMIESISIKKNYSDSNSNY